MSRLDDIKAAYDNIQVPAELKERVLQSMERGKKDACGEKKNPEKRLPEKVKRNQKERSHASVCPRGRSSGGSSCSAGHQCQCQSNSG